MRVANAEVYLLDRHLKRLSRSVEFFAFECDVERVRHEILRAVPSNAGVCCVRLQLVQDGAISLELQPLPAGYAQQLRLSSVIVNSADAFLYHKTTKRGLYEKARRDYDDRTDAILVNERGEITETTIMNIAVFREGRWITPRVSCGLLPGTMREELLDRGEIEEGVVPANALRPGEVIRCFNALRGVCEVVLESRNAKYSSS